LGIGYSGDREEPRSGAGIEMQAFVEAKLEGIRALCREYGVARLELFGSAATDDFDANRSDVDFLATYPDGYDFGPWLGRLQDFEAALAELLGRDVDVVMISALRNKWFRREAEKTRTVIYDASEVSQVA
jgi:predicted nucleotidyltransferase